MNLKITLFCFLLLADISLLNAQTLQATEKEALVNITVADFAEKPRKGEIIIITNTRTKAEVKGISDAKGKLSLLLPKGAEYNIAYMMIADKAEYNKIQIPNEPGIFTMDIKINFEMPKTYILDNVYFDTGKATLRSESFQALDNLLATLQSKQNMKIEISGHTDNVGNAEANRMLSLQRAIAVKEYLMKKGIPANRMSVKGYGDTVPVDDNSTEAGRQKNRRTEVQIIQE